MYFPNLAGMMIFGGLMAVMFLIVPWEKIKRFLAFGFAFGVILPLVIIHVMQNVFGLWIHRSIDFLTVADIPVFLAISWFPAIVIFSHLIIQYRSFVLRLLLLLGAGFGVVTIQFLQIANNMLTFNNWSLFGTFLLTIVIHIGLLAVLHLMDYLDLRELVS